MAAPKKPSAISKLQPSTLAVPQREGWSEDVDLTSLKLAVKGKASFDILAAVTGGEIERTIEGASTITIPLHDRDDIILRNAYLGQGVDIKIDGIWFRLVRIEANDNNQLVLKFEDREIAIMRLYNKPKKVAKGKMNRAQFARSLVREVKEIKIPFICPELKQGEIIAPPKKDAIEDRKPGFDFVEDFPIGEASFSTPEQRKILSDMLGVAYAYDARRKVMVSMVMAAIQESRVRNLPGGDRDSIGVLQQRPSQGWGTPEQLRRVDYQAEQFLDRAIPYDAQHPNIGFDALAQAIQRSAYPTAYRQWRTQAERIVSEFGSPGGTTSKPDDMDDANLQRKLAMFDFEVTNQAFDFGYSNEEWTRGTEIEENGKVRWDREDTWDCLGRLAEEVNWRRFVVSGKVYFCSEVYLFKSKLMGKVARDTHGIIDISGVYDVGRKAKDATLIITANITRWSAPPGSMIAVLKMGPLSGRWLVASVRRPIFSTTATITCKKPRPRLPEPADENAFLFAGGDVEVLDYGLGAKGQGSFPGTQSVGDGSYVQPVAGKMPASSAFLVPDPEGAPDSLGNRYHGAVDWSGSTGTPVVAPISGEIVEIRTAADVAKTSSNPDQVFGGVVKMQQANGYVWVFRHVDPIVVLKIGSAVKQGQQIASIADWPKHASGEHTHIEIWRTLAGGYQIENMLDPIKFLKGEVA